MGRTLEGRIYGEGAVKGVQIFSSEMKPFSSYSLLKFQFISPVSYAIP